MKLKPAITFSNYYEVARFDLTWRINLFLACVLPLLGVALLIFNQPAYLTTFIGWFITLILLLIMRQTARYMLSAIIFTSLGLTLVAITLIGFPKEVHFVDTLWAVIVLLFSYFTLGKIWGNLSMLLIVGSLSYYIYYQLNYSMKEADILNHGQLLALIFNTSICMLIIAYLIYQFINTTQYAEANYLRTTNELRLKNEKVENQNEEKTVMLREIHHRVKNNLQVITSLLRLQAREAKDVKTIELFKDSTNRVVAMALIHEKMYQNSDLAKINLEDYLKTLLNDLIDSYSVEIPIHADIRSNVEMISNKSLVPLALLFNELVSNSLKHAFQGKEEGKIKIDIYREKGKIILSYWDNGVWREKQKDSSFGLELVESLTEQLDGTYRRSTKQGTFYEFILPDNL